MFIKSILISVGLFIAYSPAQAQVSFKDIPLGASQAELLKIEPQLTCITSKDDAGQATCSFSPESFCISKAGAEGAECRAAVEARMTYGGVPAAILLILIDNKVAAAGATFNSKSFSTVADALQGKYQAPISDEKSQVTNRMGATFENRVINWQLNPDIVITASRFAGGNITRSRVLFSTSAYRAKAVAGSKNAGADI